MHYKRHSKTDVVGWTDAGIGTDGEVGLGWMILERAWPHGVVAMGHVYQSAEEAQDGKDSSREELKALTWAHRRPQAQLKTATGQRDDGHMPSNHGSAQLSPPTFVLFLFWGSR